MSVVYRMFWIVAVLIAASLTGPEAASAQAERPDAEVLAWGFAAGDARGLLAEAGSRVEVALFGSSTLYSRSQAQYVLHDFFRSYPPRGFEVREMSSAAGSAFLVGDYFVEGQEEPLQVYVRLRQVKTATWEIRELRIDERLRE